AKALADQVGAFAQYTDPSLLMSAETLLLQRIAATLRSRHYENLAQLLAMQPRPDDSIITVAARFFFRRAVEDDPQLFQGLAFSQLESIQKGQSAGLATIKDLLSAQGDKL